MQSLDPETYVQQDPDERSQERSIIPEELQPQPPPSGSPAGRLLPDPCRKQVGHTANEDENEEEEDCVEEEQERRPRKKQKSPYDPFSNAPTPLAIRHCRRKRN